MAEVCDLIDELRKLFQFAKCFVHFLRILLLFALLDGFVLVLALVEFQFEQIGNVLGALSAAAIGCDLS